MPKDSPTRTPPARPQAPRSQAPRPEPARPAARKRNAPHPQIVLVLQGGGALGAFQAGVYQALCEAGLEPHWVIGTSIGAVNGALIAGNPPPARLPALEAFWRRLGERNGLAPLWLASPFDPLAAATCGIPGLFRPSAQAPWGLHDRVGPERAAFYSTAPLRQSLAELVDFDYLAARHVRLTVGAVAVARGEMHYFDSRDRALSPEHVMASAALPPGFPAIRVAGEAYWDGGLYSNTPVEAVLDDEPRRSSLIFAVDLWQKAGPEPMSLWQVLGRQKDIAYASRAESHLARQAQLHRLRHVVRELERRLSEEQRRDPAVRELAAYGCSTVMHLVRLPAPSMEHEDHTKDVDFGRVRLTARWQAGHAGAAAILARKPWESLADPLQGVVVHEAED